MVILPKEDQDKIVQVIDYILAHPGTKVKAIKEKFDLTMEEYDQISTLMMPAQRQYSLVVSHKMRLSQLLSKFGKEKETFENAKRKSFAGA